MSERTWLQKPKKNQHIPFGYKLNEGDPELLDPIPEHLEALFQLLTHMKKFGKGVVSRDCSDWLKKVVEEGGIACAKATIKHGPLIRISQMTEEKLNETYPHVRHTSTEA